MNLPGQPSSTAEARDALHDLVEDAVSTALEPEELRLAVRRWSHTVSSPAEVVALAAALRPALGRSTRRVEALDLVTRLAVDAVATRQLAEALVDPLTGLATRSRMQDEGEHLLALSRRTGGPLTVVVLDVDGLKQVNDEQGHGAGDAALAEVGRAVREHLRGADRAFRWGGDEFVLLLPGTSLQDARRVVDRVQRSCGTPTSVGLAGHDCLPESADLTALLAAADADLYSRRRAVRAAFAPRLPRRNPFAGARSGVLLGLLAVAAGLLGWTGATLAGVAGPTTSAPRHATQALGAGRLTAPVVQAPRVTTPTAVSRAQARAATRSRPVVAPRVVPAPAHVPVVHVPVPAVPVVHVPVPPVPAPPAPGDTGLVGGVLGVVHDLLSAVL